MPYKNLADRRACQTRYNRSPLGKKTHKIWRGKVKLFVHGLLGNKCSSPGCTICDNDCLEIDYIEFQLLCGGHHTKKTLIQQDWRPKDYEEKQSQFVEAQLSLPI